MNASVGGREMYGAENDYLADSQLGRYRGVVEYVALAGGQYRSGSLPLSLCPDGFSFTLNLNCDSPISPSHLLPHVMSPVYHE